MVSFCENPGSRKWTCTSTSPGTTWRPPEVYDPVGNAPGGHDTPPVDGKLPGRKTAAVINYGIGIKRLHLRKRKKIGQLKQLP